MSHSKKFYKPPSIFLPQKNLLQLACTYGDLPFIESLLKSGNFNVNDPDQESNCTALHSSVYHQLFGVAALLTAYGAKWDCEDFDGCFVWDYLNDSRDFCTLAHDKCLLYSWGNNFTLNLGIETGNSKHTPTLVKGLEKINIRKIVVSKYHSVILDEDGKVYACGIGEGGRLGHGDGESCVFFKSIDSLRDKIIDVCAGNGHTMFLSDQGYVYSCGMNDFGQLGVGNTSDSIPAHSLFPSKLNHKDIRNVFFSFISCSNFHSVVSTENKLYTFGRNFGQLGYPSGKLGQIQYIPKVITSFNRRKDTKLICLSACDSVTAGLLSNNSIFVCENFNCKFYAINKANISLVYSRTFYFTQISTYGMISDPDSFQSQACKPCTPLLDFDIILLDNFNSLWRFSSGNVSIEMCRFHKGYDIKVSHFALGKNLFLSSIHGELFQCQLPQILIPETLPKNANFLDLTEHSKLQDAVNPIIVLNRIDYLHNVLKFFTDKQCENFFALIHDPVANLELLPRISTSTYCSDLKTRFRDIQSNPPEKCITIESQDCRLLYIDSFIFYSFISRVSNKLPDLSNFPPTIENQFKFPLEYPILYSIFDTVYDQSSELPSEFSIFILTLHSIFPNLPEIKTPVQKPKKLVINFLPEFHDTVITCLDGDSFKCHKCILIARSEYFSSMLTLGWQESCSNVSQLNFHFTLLIMEIIIEYIYTDLFPRSISEQSLYQLLIASDHFLLPRIKDWVESKLTLTLSVDNVIPILELSQMYNAQQLTVSCIEFICINFGWLISKHELETLELDVLALISDCARTRAIRKNFKDRKVYKYDHYPDLVEEFLAQGTPKEVVHHRILQKEPLVKCKTSVSKKSKRISSNSRTRTVSEGSKDSVGQEEFLLSSSPTDIVNEPWKPTWLKSAGDVLAKLEMLENAKITSNFNDILLEERSTFLHSQRPVKSVSKVPSNSDSDHSQIPKHICWGISTTYVKKTQPRKKRTTSEGQIEKKEKTWSTIEIPTNISFEDIYQQQLTRTSPDPVVNYSETTTEESSSSVCCESKPQIRPISPVPLVNNFESIVIEDKALVELRHYYNTIYPYEQITIERELANEKRCITCS